MSCRKCENSILPEGEVLHSSEIVISTQVCSRGAIILRLLKYLLIFILLSVWVLPTSPWLQSLSKIALIFTATSLSSKSKPLTGALSLYLDLLALKYRLLSTFRVDLGCYFYKLPFSYRLCLSSAVLSLVDLLKKEISTAFYFNVLSTILLKPSLVYMCCNSLITFSSCCTLLSSFLLQ